MEHNVPHFVSSGIGVEGDWCLVIVKESVVHNLTISVVRGFGMAKFWLNLSYA
jgi:hypothetical protein